MRTFCGAVTETNDLGVVAEHCPHCDRLMSCLLRTVSRGNYICFVKLAELARESSCMCTGCLKAFPGKPYWNYAAALPIHDARQMELHDLLAKTNPILADRIQFKEQIRELGGDDRFAAAYENVEGMRPGMLRSELLQRLLDWHLLVEEQRAELGQQIGALSRAWQFARQLSIGFPASPGSLAYFIAAILLVPVLIWMFITRNWFWGSIVVAAGLMAMLIVEYFLVKRSINQWTLQTLIPEAQEDNIPLDRFIAVVDDIPGSKLGLTEDLWPMKDQLPNICEILTAEGKLHQASHL